ncbi:MAG: Fmu (Sun) domain-containing protein [Chitinophagaceae bacterium]|nr:Fmu (Sun) domain-containing protein [Chitinophagaceae bacterium]
MQNRFYSYLKTTELILASYKGDQPFVFYTKAYFNQHKKHGSKDRKMILSLCYAYFRMGKAFNKLTIEEKIKIGFFICNESPKDFTALFPRNFIENWKSQLDKRIQFIDKLYPEFKNTLFPFFEELGAISDCGRFIESHFVQPNLFLRVRPNQNEIVIKKLQDSPISYQLMNKNCIAINNTTKVDELVSINNEVVVQDYSSQSVEEFMLIVKENLSETIQLWDCCAASGGKTILAKDIFKDLKITVSDTRASILQNLKKRFKEAGIHQFTSFVADVAKPIETKKTYNFIICDVPCSGSGTWSRTPEQISFFSKEKIEDYYQLQCLIANNALKSLGNNGYFLYITCSVFKKENEDVVEKILKNNSIELVSSKYFEGFTLQADTMFAALFKKVK